jgi:hypothetical protein
MGYLRLFVIPSRLDDFSIQTALVFMRISTQNNEEPEKEIQKQGQMNEDLKKCLRVSRGGGSEFASKISKKRIEIELLRNSELFYC